ncbi:MAG: hypothetical protein JWO88_2602 [Frankiales bacterium]|nr:hypothetical protein [Frankiales bacterium]
MDETRRTKAIAAEESRIERATTLTAELCDLVGDPETVVDRHGWWTQPPS